MSQERRKVVILKGELKSKVGYFHGFFQYGDEDSQCPMAIVELESGEVKDVNTEWIKFIDVEKNKKIMGSNGFPMDPLSKDKLKRSTCKHCGGSGKVWNHMLGGNDDCEYCCGICGEPITVIDSRCDNCGRVICKECKAEMFHEYTICKECSAEVHKKDESKEG